MIDKWKNIVDNVITNRTIYFYIKHSFDSKIILYKFIFEYHNLIF
jgi:hypothetical protein